MTSKTASRPQPAPDISYNEYLERLARWAGIEWRRDSMHVTAENSIRKAAEHKEEIERLTTVFAEACSEVRLSHNTPCFCKYCYETKVLQAANEIGRLPSETDKDRGTAALRAAFGEELWSLGHPAYVVTHLREEHSKMERLWKEASAEVDRLRRAAETTSALGPREPDNSMVICPNCTCQFVAIPVNAQAQQNAMARWIVQRGQDLRDHACPQCLPEGGDLVKPDFVCAYHIALSLVGPVQKTNEPRFVKMDTEDGPVTVATCPACGYPADAKGEKS